uniref:Uncharacterized protein n=1 Tax=Rhizophora mucronata TaxID=61149 RepID=A0A2P2ITL7_RHIMU
MVFIYQKYSNTYQTR